MSALKTRFARRLGFLLLGIAAVWLSDLFFASEGGTRSALLAGGIVLVVGAWVALAVLGWKSAIAATAVVGVGVFLLSPLGVALRRESFRMLAERHRDELAEAVRILQPVRMAGRMRGGEPLCARLPDLPAGECARLQAVMKDLGAHDAWKEGTVTVFELYGMLDSRGGILHCPPEPGRSCATMNRRHIQGEWYQWWAG